MSEQNNISMDAFFPPSAPVSDAPIVKECKVCNLALGPLEISSRLSYHFDCRVCEYCKNEITTEMMQRWLLDKGPRAHSTCYETYMQEEIAKRPVEITQGMLDYLNNWRLTPDMTKSVESNQDTASLKARKCIVDMSFDEQYVLLKMAQSFTATISVIISQNKESAEVKLRRQKADEDREKSLKKLVGDAEQTRLSQQAQKEEKQNKKLLSKQTPEGKLLNMFMKMGMTLEQAKHQLATSKKIGETQSAEGPAN